MCSRASTCAASKRCRIAAFSGAGIWCFNIAIVVLRSDCIRSTVQAKFNLNTLLIAILVYKIKN
jgi:hypothetical protein